MSDSMAFTGVQILNIKPWKSSDEVIPDHDSYLELFDDFLFHFEKDPNSSTLSKGHR
jgi:hypothetical protein